MYISVKAFQMYNVFSVLFAVVASQVESTQLTEEDEAWLREIMF